MTATIDHTDIRAARLRQLPPFLFDEIDRKKRERIAAGADVINLGVGDPDQPTPAFIVEEMNRAMRMLVNQQYPAVGGGLKRFRESAARFMERRFGVRVDPMKHILALLGSKDGIAHLPWAVTNPGDLVIAPDPAYPVYETGAIIASCRVHKTPVSAATGWKPDLPRLGEELDRRAATGENATERLLWVNYPSNPTAAGADLSFYESLLTWAKARRAARDRCELIICSDVAYSELYLDGERSKPVSMWQARGAGIDDTMGIEFHSLSKTFNMTGWRIGFAVGHPSLIAALQTVKSNVDSGTFNAIQEAGAHALDQFDHPDIERMRRLYRERRDAIAPGLREIGCEVENPPAGFFVWARTPRTSGGTHVDSMTFAARLLDEADTVVVPGAGFSATGPAREYFRVALTVEAARLRETVERIKRIRW
jgi:LL-diaminopimelate aminotransferase